LELRRPKTCPRCGSSKFMEIIYGRPTSEGMDAVDRGEATLGSCFIMPGQPDWECSMCGYQWFDSEDPVRIRREKLLSDLIDGNLDDNKDA
jgi:hypothetical protein